MPRKVISPSTGAQKINITVTPMMVDIIAEIQEKMQKKTLTRVSISGVIRAALWHLHDSMKEKINE